MKQSSKSLFDDDHNDNEDEKQNLDTEPNAWDNIQYEKGNNNGSTNLFDDDDDDSSK